MQYEINRDTQLVLPIDNKCSKVVENGHEYIIENNSFSVIEHSCEYFGSSFDGRKEGTKRLTGITHKSPIIIEESQGIIFFPTKAPEHKECIWISLNKINKYYSNGKGQSIIEFSNGDELELNMSIGSLTNQILRATRLKFVLDKRIEKKDNYL